MKNKIQYITLVFAIAIQIDCLTFNNYLIGWENGDSDEVEE